MTIELNLPNLLFILFAMLGAFWALVKVIVGQYEKSLDTRFSTLAQTIAKDQEVTRQLERELLRLQSELPRLYVRQEDYRREFETLQLTIQRELVSVRASTTRIEDFLMKK